MHLFTGIVTKETNKGKELGKVWKAIVPCCLGTTLIQIKKIELQKSKKGLSLQL